MSSRAAQAAQPLHPGWAGDCAAAAILFLLLVPASGGAASAPAAADRIVSVTVHGSSLHVAPAAVPGWPAPTATGCDAVRTAPGSRTAPRTARRSPGRETLYALRAAGRRRRSVAAPVADVRPAPSPPRTG